MSRLEELGGLKAAKKRFKWLAEIGYVSWPVSPAKIEDVEDFGFALIERIEELEDACTAQKLLFDRLHEWNEEWQEENPKERELTWCDAKRLIEWKLQKLLNLLEVANKAIDAAETMWRSKKPRKLDQALTWRANDELVEHFIEEFRNKYNKQRISLYDDIDELLLKYPDAEDAPEKEG